MLQPLLLLSLWPLVWPKPSILPSALLPEQQQEAQIQLLHLLLDGQEDLPAGQQPSQLQAPLQELVPDEVLSHHDGGNVFWQPCGVA